jgi:hypothetical protein
VESARATLKRYLRDGSIVLTSETGGGDGKQAYVASNPATPSRA